MVWCQQVALEPCRFGGWDKEEEGQKREVEGANQRNSTTSAVSLQN